MEEFFEYLYGRAGDSLRVVTWYRGDDYGVVYRRDGLDPEGVQRRVRAAHDRLTSREVGPTEMGELGELEATVELREETVVLHFPAGEDSGVLVSMDADVARDLHSFVSACSRRLADGFEVRKPS